GPAGSTFDGGADGWQSTGTGCNLLGVLPDLQIPLICTTTNQHRATGGNPGGALFTDFSAVANLLGIITGNGTFRSPDFTITGTPTSAQFSLQRKASISGLINQGGTVDFAATLVRTDVSPATRTPLVSETITQNDPSFVSVPAQNLAATDVAPGVYHLELSGQFTTAQLQAAQGQVGIAYDNVRLRVQDGTDDGNVAPAVFTLPATGVSESTATLNGLVDPNGSETSYAFDYRAAGTDAFTTTAAAAAGSGTAPLPFSAAITSGLATCTSYEYRVRATNAQGEGTGDLVPFRTFCAPDVVTLPASPIGADNAGLSMSLRPNGPPTVYRYEISTNPDLAGAVRTEVRGPIEGNGVSSPLTETLATLPPSTTFFYRAIAGNRLGATNGAIVSFRTQARSGPGAPGAPGAQGARGTAGRSGGSSQLNNGDQRALLRIRSALVRVGSRGRRAGQIRLRIFCRTRTGQNCAGTVKLRTRGKINPSSIPGRRKAKRKVTFSTFEYQLAVGKTGVAIATIQPEKLDLLRRIRRAKIDIIVTVTDIDNNRQAIRRKGSIVLTR
nr:hypothetical protein [Solirubrobacterales bacterium]